MKKILLGFSLILLSITLLYADSNEKTKFRVPTVNEFLAQQKAGIIKSLAEAMRDASTIGEVEAALQTPCVRVWISSSIVGGRLYMRLQANFDGCEE